MKRGFLKNKSLQPPKKDAQNASRPTIQKNSDAQPPQSRQFKVVQMPYGKVEGAGVLPADHKPSNIQYKEYDPDTLNYDKGVLVYTTQPSQLLNARVEDVPDGWAECLLTSQGKRRLLSTPGYPQPILRPPQVRHEVGKSDYHGLGVFATRDISLGSLVFSERPLIIVYNSLGYSGNLEYLFSLPEEMQKQVMLAHREEKVQPVFDRMPKENQEKYMKLQNSHQFDGSGPITGIMRTNAFFLNGFNDMDEESVKIRREVDFRMGSYSGIFDQLSRLNHSCSPNTTYNFDVPSLSMRLYATRDIKKGEELFISYLPELLIPASERATGLAPYDLVCTCAACANPSLSDANRKKIATIDESLLQDSQTDAHQVLQLFELVEKEGLHSLKVYADLLLHLTVASISDAELENAMKYGKRYFKVCGLEGGSVGAELESLSYQTFCDPEKLKNLPNWGQRK